MDSSVGVGGVDEPARSTDIFYGLALLLSVLAVHSFLLIKTAECDSPSPRAIQLHAAAKTLSSLQIFAVRLMEAVAKNTLF